MPSKRQTLWVIFAGPQQHGGPGTRYIASDGSVTTIKSKAAKFYSHGAAQEFAEERGIELTETMSIGQEEFTDFEIAGG